MDTAESNGRSPAPATPDLLTRDRAKQAKRAREALRVFHLVHTGGDALVRYLSLADAAAVGRMPAHLQSRVLAALRQAEGAREEKPGQRDILKLLQLDDDTANLYVLAGFVAPQVVEREADLEPDRDDQVLLDDIDPRDRKRFFRVCEGQAEAEADELLPFFRQPAQPVVAGGFVGGDRTATVGPAWPERPV